MKEVRHSFSGSIPAKFEHKLRCHKQTFGKIAAITYYTFSNISHWELFLQNRSRELFRPIVASKFREVKLTSAAALILVNTVLSGIAAVLSSALK